MELLSEDPTYLAGGLALVAVALLITMRVTQQGRYLVGGLIALALAVAVLALEFFWVTDTERIERVVYDLRDAVAASDAERVLTYLSPDAEFVQEGSRAHSSETTRAYIRSNLGSAKFDFLRISRLKAQAFPQTRRGIAEFRIIAGGSLETPLATYNFGTTNSDWSLGFEEASPHVWKVNRITPTRIPRELPGPGGDGSRRERPRFRMPGPGPG
jgi:hypothetical protein